MDDLNAMHAKFKEENKTFAQYFACDSKFTVQNCLESCKEFVPMVRVGYCTRRAGHCT